jgi:organic hydroperoxide reductase OsmC/OhrA
MNDVPHFALELEQVNEYEFRARFDLPGMTDLRVDEAPPLGRGRGPNPARLVAIALAQCLSSSLLFCLGKFHEGTSGLRTRVSCDMTRNERGRVRLKRFDVTIQLPCEAQAIAHLHHCLRQFEDFCIVTESLRKAVPVDVVLVDSGGRRIWTSADQRSLEAIA